MVLSRTAFAGALLAFVSVASHATDIVLPTSGAQAGYGQWQAFNVSDIDSASFGVEWIDNANSASAGFGSPLGFSFSIAAGRIGTLTVVDAGFAGDTFKVFDGATLLGSTSPVPAASYDPAASAVVDFDAAAADARFSKGVFTLGAGTYHVTGELAQSVLIDGAPLNSTVGALQLTTVAAVPEPSTLASLMAGLGLLTLTLRRRRG